MFCGKIGLQEVAENKRGDELEWILCPSEDNLGLYTLKINEGQDIDGNLRIGFRYGRRWFGSDEERKDFMAKLEEEEPFVMRVGKKEVVCGSV